MSIEPIYSLSFVALTILATILFVKRSGGKGCLTFGYIALVLLCINLFTIFSWMFMYSTTRDIIAVAVSGKSYTSQVVSYTSHNSEDSDGRSITMYTPTVRFITEDGKTIQKELSFSTSGLKVGDTYKINYNEETGKVVTLGFTLSISFVGAFLFTFIFSILFIGQILYIFGYEMDKYKQIVMKAGFYFFLPFIMIGFDVLLIYALFYGNEVPIFVTGILIFFIFVLTLAILGVGKMLIQKGLPTMTRVSGTRWTGGWNR